MSESVIPTRKHIVHPRQEFGADIDAACESLGLDLTLLSPDAAAQFLGVEIATLEKLSAANESLRPTVQFGGYRTWRRRDLANYLEGLKVNSEACVPGTAETAPSDTTLGDVFAALEARTQADSLLLAKASADVADVGRWMVARDAAAMSAEVAAAYLGISTEALGRLAAVVPSLRPVSPVEGVVVWRRSDIDRFLAALPQ